METIVETSVWKIDCVDSLDKKTEDILCNEILMIGFDDIALKNDDIDGLAVFVRRTINMAENIDFMELEQPLEQIRECILRQSWVDELVDAEVRHDIIGLDLERMQVVTRQYHFDIAEGLEAISSL